MTDMVMFVGIGACVFGVPIAYRMVRDHIMLGSYGLCHVCGEVKRVRQVSTRLLTVQVLQSYKPGQDYRIKGVPYDTPFTLCCQECRRIHWQEPEAKKPPTTETPHA